MKRPANFAFSGVLLGVFLAAQTQTLPPSGAAIVLPQQLVTGQPATLAVIGADGRLLSNVAIEFSGGKRAVTDSLGQAQFRAPDEGGVMVVRVAGTSVVATAMVVAPGTDAPGGVQVTQLPRVIMLGEPFGVRGVGFRGEAEANRVSLGEQPALVLAASPVALVVLPSAKAMPGPAQLVIEVNGRSSGPMPLHLIALDLVFNKSRLAAGEKGKLEVRVRGSEEPLDLEIRNSTPEIVRLPRGEVQRVRTRGGQKNQAAVSLQGIRPGDYAISVRLVRAAAGLPDTETARQRLVAALALAPPDWAPRVGKLIDLLAENPQNALHVRNELEKLLAETPPGEFGRLLESAWRALLAP